MIASLYIEISKLKEKRRYQIITKVKRVDIITLDD